MKEFTFVAKTAQGQGVREEMLANDSQQALDLLHKRGLTVIKLDEIKERSLWHRLNNPVKVSVLVMVFRQLAAMLESGIGLNRALNALTQDEGLPPNFLKTLQKVETDVRSGYALSQSLRLYPQYFDPFLVGSVRIGELTGRLASTISHCADGLEKEYAHNLKLRQALIYPSVLLLSLGLLMAFCYVYMIPVFLDLFSEVDITLPAPTRALMAVSNFFKTYGPMIFWTGLPMLIAFIWYMSGWLKTRSGRWTSENWLLKLPWYGRQAGLRLQSRYFRSLCTLLQAAVPLMSALQVVRDSSSYELIRATADAQMKDIAHGGTFSSGLRRSGIFEPMALELIKVSEDTGQTTKVMGELADRLDEEMNQGLALISKLIEPIVLAILGIGLSFVMLAAFLPIYSLAQSL